MADTPADAPNATDPGSRATISIGGVNYQVDETTCAACRAPVLIASGPGKSQLYDRISLVPAAPVDADRHRCSLPRETARGLFRDPAPGPGAYRRRKP